MALTKVTAGVIAANAVVDSFGSQSITGDKIGLTAINANNIVTGAVTGDKLGITSINANNIVDATITNAKIISVANTKISGNIISSQIAPEQIFYGNTIISGSGSYLRLASGTGGIQFNGDTSSANALDDYEEGTFTPTVSGASSAGSASYNIQQGTYTKVGRVVTVSLRIEVISFTGTGALQVNGFPFATAQLSPLSMEYIAPVMTNGMNWTGGSQVVYYMPPNATYGNIFYMADDAAWGVQQCVNESFNIILTMTYVTT